MMAPSLLSVRRRAQEGSLLPTSGNGGGGGGDGDGGILRRRAQPQVNVCTSVVVALLVVGIVCIGVVSFDVVHLAATDSGDIETPAVVGAGGVLSLEATSTTGGGSGTTRLSTTGGIAGVSRAKAPNKQRGIGMSDGVGGGGGGAADGGRRAVGEHRKAALAPPEGRVAREPSGANRQRAINAPRVVEAPIPKQHRIGHDDNIARPVATPMRPPVKAREQHRPPRVPATHRPAPPVAPTPPSRPAVRAAARLDVNGLACPDRLFDYKTSELRVGSGQHIVLASVPRTGNTYTRRLVERSTLWSTSAVYSDTLNVHGSVTTDSVMFKSHYPFLDYPRNKNAVVVQRNANIYGGKSGMATSKKVTKAVVLVRNIFDAYVSYCEWAFNGVSYTNDAEIPEGKLNSRVGVYVMEMERFFRFWFEEFWGDVHVARYERLVWDDGNDVAAAAAELEMLETFLGIRVVPDATFEENHGDVTTYSIADQDVGEPLMVPRSRLYCGVMAAKCVPGKHGQACRRAETSGRNNPRLYPSTIEKLEEAGKAIDALVRTATGRSVFETCRG